METMNPSTPAWTPAAQKQDAMRDPEKYRTELCRTFSRFGRCRYGDACQFAHGAANLRPKRLHPRYKTTKCRTFWSKGECPYGSRCMFLHDEHVVAAQPAPPQPADVWAPAPAQQPAQQPAHHQQWAALDMSDLAAALPLPPAPAADAAAAAAAVEEALLGRHELSVLDLLDDAERAERAERSSMDDGSAYSGSLADSGSESDDARAC